MTPQAARFLAKAERLLTETAAMFSISLNDAAGRTAYLAGLHAAQALIFERTGKIFKSHNGVQTEFLRLTKDDPRLDSDLRTFLSRAYNLKAIADYEAGPDAEVSPERASEAIATGKLFVAALEKLIGS